MADGDVVKKITISATGENIDSTTASINSLSAANDNATKSASNTGSSLVNLAAGTYVAKTAYEALTASSDSASASMGAATTAITSAIGAVLAYAPNKIGEIWQEGIDKLNSYVELSTKAGSLSTDYYQRLVQGATDAKKPADEYLKVIQNINSALDRKLGTNGNQNGSTFNTEVLDLQKNGNLQGQTADVNRLNNSVTGQEQLNAALKLIQDAQDAGEKLVAFKLTNTLMGPEAAANLKNDSDYIFQIQKSIEDASAKDFIKQEDVDRAVSMSTELENAKKIIDSWFTGSVKSDWSALGIEIQQMWLNANTNFAATLSWLDKIFARTTDIANIKPNPDGSIWTKIGDYFSGDGQNMPAGMSKMNDTDRQFAVAQQSLGSQLGNKNNVTSARQQLQKADDWLTPDQSSPPPAATVKAVNDVNDAIDRAINTLTKHVAVQEADAKAIGLGDGALAAFRAEAAETAAVQANGGKETDAQALSFATLRSAAYDAADALAKAKVASAISRGSQEAFLSPADVAIANELKGIYGDNIPRALQSAEAEALRMNDILKTINTTARSAVSTFANDLVTGLETGKGVMQSLESAAASLGKTLQTAGINSLVTSGMNALTGSGGMAASLTAGGTSAAAAITAACTAGGAALASGGVAAGTAITGGGVAVGVGGTTAGTTVGAGGAAAGGALAAGGVAAGSALWGPIAALAAVVGGIGLSMFGGSSSNANYQTDLATMNKVAQTNQDAQARQVVDAQNAQLAGMDSSTLQGQLGAFDISSQQQRLAEAKSGNGAIVELEQSLAAQRLAIINKSNAAIETSMQNFLDSVTTGSLSTLSPADQLAYEQNLFNTQLSGAQGGNSTDLNALTTTAQSLLTLAQNFYASGTGYAATYNQVTSAISALATNTNQNVAPDAGITTGPDVVANIGYETAGAYSNPTGVGYASGGLVKNGKYGVDSVTARLAGGEHVTRSSSVNANTIGALSYINKTGKNPGDNSQVVSVLTQGFNGQTRVLSDKLDEIAARISRVENVTRQSTNQRRVPGTKAA